VPLHLPLWTGISPSARFGSSRGVPKRGPVPAGPAVQRWD
jgi:hypothetical protein